MTKQILSDRELDVAAAWVEENNIRGLEEDKTSDTRKPVYTPLSRRYSKMLTEREDGKYLGTVPVKYVHEKTGNTEFIPQQLLYELKENAFVPVQNLTTKEPITLEITKDLEKILNPVGMN